MSNTRRTEIAAVAVTCGGRIWIQRRRDTGHLDGYWEFPGGKVKPGEHPREAARRELDEEAGLRVEPEDLIPLASVDYQDAQRRLRLHFYRCEVEPALLSGGGRWVSLSELSPGRLPPANREVLSQLRAQCLKAH